MKPLAAVILLTALVFAAWGERSAGPHDPARGVGALAPGCAEAQRDAWFLRAIELSLATGSVPRQDRFLDGGELRAAPFAPLFPILTAGLLRHTAFAELEPLARGSLAPRRLESLLEFGLPLLGALACVAVFLAARSLQGGAARNLAGLVAAAIYALAPSVIFAERVGRVDSFALETILACALIAVVQFALRASEDVDGTLGGLLAGVLAGLNLACGWATLPVLVGVTAIFLAAAWRDRPAARRAFMLYAICAALSASMALGSLRAEPGAWPSLRSWRLEGLEQLSHAWLSVAVLPAGLVLLLLGGSLRERALPALLGVLALVWALLFQPFSAGVALSACLLLGVAVADHAGQGRRTAFVLALCALFCAPALVWRGSETFRPSTEELEARSAWSAGLDWVRYSTPSTGPWNHPGARPDGVLLAAPAVALEVAVRARRAVLAAEPAGVHADAQSRLRSEHARAWLDAPPSQRLVAELLRAGVRHVIVGPDPDLHAPGGLADVLARSQSEQSAQGFERLWQSEARRDGLPVLSIWSLGPREEPDEVPTLRAR